MQQISNEIIDSKVKEAQNNISNSYKQYLDDIEGIKILVPQNKHIEVEALIMEIDALHEHLMQFVETYLRPYVSSHIRTILAQDKITNPANDILTESRHTA